MELLASLSTSKHTFACLFALQFGSSMHQRLRDAGPEHEIPEPASPHRIQRYLDIFSSFLSKIKEMPSSYFKIEFSLNWFFSLPTFTLQKMAKVFISSKLMHFPSISSTQQKRRKRWLFSLQHEKCEEIQGYLLNPEFEWNIVRLILHLFRKIRLFNLSPFHS